MESEDDDRRRKGGVKRGTAAAAASAAAAAAAAAAASCPSTSKAAKKTRLRRPPFLKRNSSKNKTTSSSEGGGGGGGSSVGSSGGGSSGSSSRLRGISRRDREDHRGVGTVAAAVASDERRGSLVSSGGGSVGVGGAGMPPAALDGSAPLGPSGPRAKPGLEFNFSAGITVNLVRRTALGEMGPGGVVGTWLQRCRVSAVGLHAGCLREPSDGWGSPPPQHRGWASVVSVAAFAPPCSGRSLKVDGGSGGGGGGIGTAGKDRWGGGEMDAAAAAYGRPTDNNASSTSFPPPWLVCRAAAPAATTGMAGASGSDGGGIGGGGAPPSGKFLDVKVAGQAGRARGTGGCVSLVMSVGEVEAWAVGGAATRWLDHLGPQVWEEKGACTCVRARGGGCGGDCGGVVFGAAEGRVLSFNS